MRSLSYLFYEKRFSMLVDHATDGGSKGFLATISHIFDDTVKVLIFHIS
jgi:hypothetical protein